MVGKLILGLLGLATGLAITGLVLSQEAVAEPEQIRQEPKEPIPNRFDEQDLTVILG